MVVQDDLAIYNGKKGTMKKQIPVLIIVCLMVISGCASRKSEGFAIYLLDEDLTGTEFSTMDIDQVRLESVPLISSQDIVSYDINSHSIELTPEAYKRFQQTYPMPVEVSGIPFIVCVGSQRIYTGALWTPVSSISYDGVVIMEPWEANQTVIQITLGYPVLQVFTGSDPRADPRIIRALEQDNKLKSLP
jgi:hypothetical protein